MAWSLLLVLLIWGYRETTEAVSTPFGLTSENSSLEVTTTLQPTNRPTVPEKNEHTTPDYFDTTVKPTTNKFIKPAISNHGAYTVSIFDSHRVNNNCLLRSGRSCSLEVTDAEYNRIVEKFVEFVRAGAHKITLKVNIENEVEPNPLYVNTSRYYQPDTFVWLRQHNDAVLSLSDNLNDVSLQTISLFFKSLTINMNSNPTGCITRLSEECKIGLVLRYLNANLTRAVSENETPNAKLCLRVVDFVDSLEGESRTGYVKYRCCQCVEDGLPVQCYTTFSVSEILKATDKTIFIIILVLILFCLPFVVLRFIPANWELPKVYQMEDTELHQRLAVIEDWNMLHYDKHVPIGPLHWLSRLCCICKVYNPDVNRKLDRYCFEKRKCGPIGQFTCIHAYLCLRNFILILIVCPLAYYIGLGALQWIDTGEDKVERLYLTYNDDVTEIVRSDIFSSSYVKDIFTSNTCVGFGLFFLFVFSILSLILIFYDRGELTYLIIKRNNQQIDTDHNDKSKIYKYFFRAVNDDVMTDLTSAFKIDPAFPANLFKYCSDENCDSLKSCFLCPLFLILHTARWFFRLLLKIPILSFVVRSISVLHTSVRIRRGKESDDNTSCKIMLHLLYCYCLTYLLFLLTIYTYLIVMVAIHMFSGLAIDISATAPYITCFVAIAMYWYGAVSEISEHYRNIKKTMFEICRLPDYQKRHALCKHVFVQDIRPLKQLTADKLIYSDALIFESSDGRTESMHRSFFHFVCDEVSPISDKYLRKLKIFVLKVLFIVILFQIIMAFNSEPSFSMFATAATAILPKVVSLIQQSSKSQQITDDILRNDIAEAIWNYEGALFTPCYVNKRKDSSKQPGENNVMEACASDEFETANEEMVTHLDNNRDEYIHNDQIKVKIPIGNSPTNKDQETSV